MKGKSDRIPKQGACRKGNENKEKKSTGDQSPCAELSTDSHQNNSEEKEGHKSNEAKKKRDTNRIRCKSDKSKNKEPLEKRNEIKKRNIQKKGHKKGGKTSKEDESQTASKNKEPVEKRNENKEKKSTGEHSPCAELSTNSHQNNSEEKDGHKLNEGVSQTESKNKEPIEKWNENKEKKSTSDQSPCVELPIDSHPKNNEEKRDTNRIKCKSDRIQNKEPVEKRNENKEKKPTGDQSPCAELSTDSHQNNSEEIEGHKSIQSLSQTESQNKEPVEKRKENKEKKPTGDQYPYAELSTDSHQNNSEEIEGHKSIQSLSQTESQNKEPVEKGNENKEKKFTGDHSPCAEVSTDSHQNNSEEKEGHKLNEGESQTASENKEPVEKRNENKEKKSTSDQSPCVDLPTDSHPKSREETEGHKSNEGKIQTSSKNKEPVEKWNENKEKKSTSDQSPCVELPIDSHPKSKEEKEGHKSIEGVSQTSSKNKEPVEKWNENKENKSTGYKSRSAELTNDSHQNNSEDKGHKSNKSVSLTESQNKEPVEKRIDNKEKKSTGDQSPCAELSTDSHQSNNEEKEGHKSNKSVSQTESQNKEPVEKRNENKEKKPTGDQSPCAELSTDSHQNNSEEIEGHKSIQSLSQTESQNKEPVEKRKENKEKKSTGDQSPCAELSTDSHQNNSEEIEGHKSSETVSQTESQNKEPVEKGNENKEKKFTGDHSPCAEVSTDSHQNNSEEKEGHKLNEGESQTASENKEPVEKRNENKEKKSIGNQSPCAELSTDSHQNHSEEKEGPKSNEGKSQTSSKNKESVEKRNANKENKSTSDKSPCVELSTDYHQNNKEENEKHKSSEGVSQTASKNKEPLEKGNENNEKKSTGEHAPCAKLSIDSHQNNIEEKEGHKSNKSVSQTKSKNKEPVDKRNEIKEKKSTGNQSQSAELVTDSHQNHSEEKEGHKSSEGVSQTASKIKEPLEKGNENNEKKSTADQSPCAELCFDFHQNNSEEKQGHKSIDGVSQTASKNKKPLEKGNENKEDKSTGDQSRSAVPTDSHQNNCKEKNGQKSRETLRETTSEIKELMKTRYDKEGSTSAPDEYRNEKIDSNPHEMSRKEKGKGKSEKVERKTWAIILPYKTDSSQKSINKKTSKENKKLNDGHMSNSSKNLKLRRHKVAEEKEISTVGLAINHKEKQKYLSKESERATTSNNKDFVKGRIENEEEKSKPAEFKRAEISKVFHGKNRNEKVGNKIQIKHSNSFEIQNLQSIKNQADELRGEGTFCNNDLMLQQKPFNIENNSQPSPESALNHEVREQQSSLFPSQPIIDTKSKDKQSLVQKGLEHNEYFFSEHKDVFSNEDYISVNENQELSLDSLPEENITLSNDIPPCELLFYPINVTEFFSSLSNFGNDHKNETNVLEIYRPSHELMLESSNMPPNSPFNLEDIDDNKSLETQNFSETNNKKGLEYSRIHKSKVVPVMQTNSKVNFIKQVKNEVSKSLNDSANKTSKAKLNLKQDEPLHPELFANVKRTKTESEILLKQKNLIKKVEINQTIVNFSNNEEKMANKRNDSNINQIPYLLTSSFSETSLFPSFNKDSIVEKKDVTFNTDKNHEMQAVPKDIYQKSSVKKRKMLNKKTKRSGGENSLHPKSEKRNFILQPTFRYKGITNGYSPNIEIPEMALSQVNQQKHNIISEEKHSISRQVSKKSSVESAIDEVCSLLSLQSIDDSKDFESKPQKTCNAFQYTYFNRKVIEPPIVNDEGKEASAKKNKEFVSNLDEQLAETSQPKNRRRAKTQEYTSIPVSSSAKDPDFTNDSPNTCNEHFEPKQRSKTTSKNTISDSELGTQPEQAQKIIGHNYDSNATTATEISKVEASTNGNHSVKSKELLTLENRATISNTTNQFLRADAQRDQISEVKNISSPNCSTYTTKGVATQVSNEASFMTAEGKMQRRSGEGLIVQQGNFVFQCALNEKSKCRLQFTSERNSANISDPELFKYNLVFERDAFKKGRY
ncbi:hypothetical protein JTE90_027766 [Oedothorax gibbosus]|uniref:Uncharacterized protein n=1 Tax=Oedothorax gibbosus TaxID=931172 RepID=A0AAV6V5Z4_9ARAC|nr:hypothetical protein JTE90_027766 [Oedothorax gibbosus]